MLKMEDVGELAYGGLVTGTQWWDEKRVDDGTIMKKEIFKKAGFYSYLIPGLFCTTSTAFGWLRRYDAWNERIAHGFIYDFPRFVKGLVDAFGEGATAGEKSAAIKEAEKLVAAGSRSKVAWRPKGIIA